MLSPNLDMFARYCVKSLPSPRELPQVTYLQGLNISPTLIVIGPYDTTVAGQVRHSSPLLAVLCLQMLLGRAPSDHILEDAKGCITLSAG